MKRKRSVPCLAAALLAFASSPAEACCHRGARRCGHHRIVYARPVAAPAAYASAPAVSAALPATYASAPAVYATAPQPVAQAVAPTPAEAPGVQPMYRYAAGEGTPAYYYTYDSSGKLIVQQWVDWVFRGGKEAGMPRPPLPIIGNFVGRR